MKLSSKATVSLVLLAVTGSVAQKQSLLRGKEKSKCPPNSTCQPDQSCLDTVEYCDCKAGFEMDDNLCVKATTTDTGFQAVDGDGQDTPPMDAFDNEDTAVALYDETDDDKRLSLDKNNRNLGPAAGVAAGAAVVAAIVDVLGFLHRNSVGDRDEPAARRAAVDQVYWSTEEKYNIVIFDYQQRWQWKVEPPKDKTAFTVTKINGKTHGLYAFQGDAVWEYSGSYYMRGWWSKSAKKSNGKGHVFFRNPERSGLPFWMYLWEHDGFYGRARRYKLRLNGSSGSRCYDSTRFNDIASSAFWSGWSSLNNVCFYEHTSCRGKVRCWSGARNDGHPNRFRKDGINDIISSFKVTWS